MSRRALPGLLLLAGALAAGGCPAFHAGPLPGAPAAAQYIDIDGVRLRYRDAGSGPAVVLIHGYASSLETWAAVVPKLAASHRVIALDLKGFGWSGRPPGDYAPAAQARLVLGLLDALGVERAALAAHSYGCSVALELALAAPERVERLALYDAYVYPEQLSMFFLWARAPWVGEALFALFYDQRPDERLMLAFYDPRRVTESLAQDVERAMQRPGTEAAALAVARGLRPAKLVPRLAAVGQPVLLLWGREDAVAPLAVGERLARDLRRAELVVYPRCGHFPMLEADAASTRDLAAFLAPEGS